MVLQGEGNDLKNAAALLRDDEIQYAGFESPSRSNQTMPVRSSSGRRMRPPPDDVFVVVSWCGRHTAEQRRNISQRRMLSR